jgi:hypothetical protein
MRSILIASLLLCGIGACATLNGCPDQPASVPDAGSPAPAPAPVTPPAPTASPPEDPTTAACAQLAALGCQEGLASNCAVTLRKVADAGVGFGVSQLACLASAASKAAVRGCGPFVACP